VLLQAGWSHFREVMKEICVEASSRHMKEKIVTGNIQSGLPKGKLYLTSLIVCMMKSLVQGTGRKQ